MFVTGCDNRRGSLFTETIGDKDRVFVTKIYELLVSMLP